MKNTIQLLLFLGIAVISTGCASPYMVDRGRDAADIFTATVGVGIGAKARVGPIQSGLGFHMDAAGLRGGEFTTGMMDADYEVMDFTLVVGFLESYKPHDSQVGDLRHKLFETHGIIAGIPEDADWATRLQYATQVEIAGGFLYGARLGFNVGELLDFILGWTTLDIYSDDLEWKKRKSNKPLERTP